MGLHVFLLRDRNWTIPLRFSYAEPAFSPIRASDDRRRTKDDGAQSLGLITAQRLV